MLAADSIESVPATYRGGGHLMPRYNLSKRLRGKYVYPYLLRGKTIDHPNQV